MFKALIRLTAFLFGTWVGIQVGIRVLFRFRPGPTPHRIAPLLGSRARLRYSDPLRILDFAGVRRNACVVDVGCGPGVLTLEALRRVGVEGQVYAVDMNAEVLDQLDRRLSDIDARNVKIGLGPADRLPVPDNCADVVVMMSMLPVIKDRGAALKEARRVLKPSGALIVGEEIREPDYVRGRTVERWAEEAGFRLVGREGGALRYMLKFMSDEYFQALGLNARPATN
ncbi:MAG: methyltransferase domain-containing protein [Thermoflexales bacterium]|nr:methyltransferase domain-containing protein [Thermoflexales bacterium]